MSFRPEVDKFFLSIREQQLVAWDRDRSLDDPYFFEQWYECEPSLRQQYTDLLAGVRVYIYQPTEEVREDGVVFPKPYVKFQVVDDEMDSCYHRSFNVFENVDDLVRQALRGIAEEIREERVAALKDEGHLLHHVLEFEKQLEGLTALAPNQTSLYDARMLVEAYNTKQKEEFREFVRERETLPTPPTLVFKRAVFVGGFSVLVSGETFPDSAKHKFTITICDWLLSTHPDALDRLPHLQYVIDPEEDEVSDVLNVILGALISARAHLFISESVSGGLKDAVDKYLDQGMSIAQDLQTAKDRDLLAEAFEESQKRLSKGGR